MNFIPQKNSLMHWMDFIEMKIQKILKIEL